MTKQMMAGLGALVVAFVMVSGSQLVAAQPPAPDAPKEDARNSDDPHGVLLKPIPDKLVALTFDDGCASGYTVAAPILKSLGFNGSFYVCDFDSFRTRKDWYLTWRQMKTLADDGFEIGNHTVGHGGGLGNYLSMEDELLANGVSKPTTVAWPVYQVAWSICPDLAANGYTFGRGGHFRAYRPTVDNPFDVPSMWCSTVEQFVACVRQATGGKIVVITFHGVPDMEHPSVGIEPETFKVMMQYLKGNGYKGIALRDLAEYIDPAKAAKLPPTANNFKEPGPPMLVKEDKPYVATTIAKPKVNTVALNKTPVSTAKDMLTFVLPGAISTTISGTRIGVYVPKATNVTALAPTFTLSPFATAVPASGTARDFTRPQAYTITAQDGSTQACTVTVVKSDKPNAFTWSKAEAGNWSDGSKWSNNLANGSAPVAAGQPDYVLNFNMEGDYAVKNDLSEGFQLNQLNLGPTRGFKWAGNPISFTTNSVTGNPPGINVNTTSESDKISIPMNLAADVAVKVIPHGRMFLEGLISGPGGLILSCPGTDGDHYSNWGILRIDRKANTYSGGTIVNSGQIFLLVAPQGLGTGPVTLNHDGDIRLEGCNGISNPLILNGGTLEGGGSWNAPITLNGDTKIAGHLSFNDRAGGMSGPGGLTQIGPIGPWGRVNAGEVSLYGANTYTGPTAVTKGTLLVKKAASLYNADTANWTPAKISVHPAATLRISAGGPGEFTGTYVGTLLRNLTTAVNNNGLMAGSVFCLDTANATGTVTVSADIADSKGPGGGAFVLKKCGVGTLQLSGNNTYTGQTILEGGTLSVSSLNSVVKGKAGGSLGAPTDVEHGEIVIGSGDGEFTLIYTGTGETSDRVINLAGKKSTVTFDQSGAGPLKLTSTFVISGYGAGKTIVLKGDTAGTGEIAGNIVNPYDRAGKATTAITKLGAGTWTLSGTNSYTGPTKVMGGVLACSNAASLGGGSLDISTGAKFQLNYAGTRQVAALTFDGGSVLPDGTYGSTASPAANKNDTYFAGSGTVTVVTPGTATTRPHR